MDLHTSRISLHSELSSKTFRKCCHIFTSPSMSQTQISSPVTIMRVAKPTQQACCRAINKIAYIKCLAPNKLFHFIVTFTGIMIPTLQLQRILVSKHHTKGSGKRRRKMGIDTAGSPSLGCLMLRELSSQALCSGWRFLELSPRLEPAYSWASVQMPRAWQTEVRETPGCGHVT